MADDKGMQWFSSGQMLETMDQNGDYFAGNRSNHTLTPEEPYQQIISDEAMYYLNLYITILLCSITAIAGTLSNVINIVIFYRLGLRDSMNVCLFALASTDFSCSLIVALTRSMSIWQTFFPPDNVDPMAIWYVIAWFSDSLYLCSGWITTFLSVERCVCVVFPFKVKQIFSRNRSVFILASMFLVIEAMYCPLYVTHWLEWTNVETHANNRTVRRPHLIVMFTTNRQEIENHVSMLTGHVLQVPALVITVGSIFWMIYGLNRSSSIRKAMTATGTGNAGSGEANAKQKADSKREQNNRRLIKVVMLLAIIFTICSIPRLYAKYLYILSPEVHEGGREVNLYSFKWQLLRVGFTLNASVNIFIYLKINSNYRAKFVQLFSIRRKSSPSHALKVSSS